MSGELGKNLDFVACRLAGNYIVCLASQPFHRNLEEELTDFSDPTWLYAMDSFEGRRKYIRGVHTKSSQGTQSCQVACNITRISGALE